MKNQFKHHTELEEVDDFVSKIEESAEKSNVSLIAINRRKKEINYYMQGNIWV